MDDQVATPTARTLTRRIHERFDTLLADLTKPLPAVPVFLPPDEPSPSALTIQTLVRQVERRGLRHANASHMTNLFVLGRALSHLDSSLAQRWLRRSMSASKAYRLFRMALRCFELYSARGHLYLSVASAITPNVLSAMSLADFESLLSYAVVLGISDLQEQIS